MNQIVWPRMKGCRPNQGSMDRLPRESTGPSFPIFCWSWFGPIRDFEIFWVLSRSSPRFWNFSWSWSDFDFIRSESELVLNFWNFLVLIKASKPCNIYIFGSASVPTLVLIRFGRRFLNFAGPDQEQIEDWPVSVLGSRNLFIAHRKRFLNHHKFSLLDGLTQLNKLVGTNCPFKSDLGTGLFLTLILNYSHYR